MLVKDFQIPCSFGSIGGQCFFCVVHLICYYRNTITPYTIKHSLNLSLRHELLKSPVFFSLVVISKLLFIGIPPTSSIIRLVRLIFCESWGTKRFFDFVFDQFCCSCKRDAADVHVQHSRSTARCSMREMRETAQLRFFRETVSCS